MALPMPPIDHPESGYLNGHHPAGGAPDRVLPFFAVEPPIKPNRLFLHLILFLATLGTATFFYAVLEGSDPVTHPWSLVSGLPFSIPLMFILLSHEMGHYLLARKHRVRATLPLLILELAVTDEQSWWKRPRRCSLVPIMDC